MATVRTNPIINGLSGMLGQGIVFKNYNGRTYVTSKPSPPKKQSAEQKANRSRFKKAACWAKAILLDPEKKVYYQQKAKKLLLPNAYTAAIADYMRKPVLKESTHHDHITYEVIKRDYEVKKVEVKTIKEGLTEIQVIEKNSFNEWVFDVFPVKLRSEVYVLATDAAGNVFDLKILT